MTTNLKLRSPVVFPANVTGAGGIKVSKSNGLYTVQPDFSVLSTVLPGDLTDPSSKQVWVYDSVQKTYSVMTLSDLGEALYTATSTTSVAIGTGSKDFTIQPGKDFSVGSFVLATSDADVTNFMLGQVTDYTGTTLTVDVNIVGGSGTFADWTIRISGTSAVTSAALALAGSTSGTTTVQASAVASGTLTLPAATDTLVGKATTDDLSNKTIDTANTNTIKINGNTLSATAGTATVTVPNSTDTLVGRSTADIFTNKTFDTAATGNSLKINGLVASGNTGTGLVVRDTSPTLITPALGTPSSVTLTNGTGLPIATGVSGLATGIAAFLATPSSANLKAAVTDETGSGALVFADTPTLVSPILGDATATSITFANNTGIYNSGNLLLGGSALTSGALLTANGLLRIPSTGVFQLSAGNTGNSTGAFLKYNGANGAAALGTTSGGTDGALSLGSIVLSGSISGTTTLQAAATASGALTLPAATDTLVGKATPDALTNKNLTSATNTFPALLADILGLTLAQGDILYFNGTNIVNLGPGTSGNFLKTLGAGANPVWASIPGGGDMLSTNNLSDVANPATALANIGGSPITRSVNAQTGTTYTFVIGDAGKLCTFSNASAVTVTVPPNSSVAFPTGTQIDVGQEGAGKVTLAQGAGVTINSLNSNKSLAGQYAGGTLIKTATDTWTFYGSLIA